MNDNRKLLVTMELTVEVLIADEVELMAACRVDFPDYYADVLADTGQPPKIEEVIAHMMFPEPGQPMPGVDFGETISIGCVKSEWIEG